MLEAANSIFPRSAVYRQLALIDLGWGSSSHSFANAFPQPGVSGLDLMSTKASSAVAARLNCRGPPNSESSSIVLDRLQTPFCSLHPLATIVPSPFSTGTFGGLSSSSHAPTNVAAVRPNSHWVSRASRQNRQVISGPGGPNIPLRNDSPAPWGFVVCSKRACKQPLTLMRPQTSSLFAGLAAGMYCLSYGRRVPLVRSELPNRFGHSPRLSPGRSY